METVNPQPPNPSLSKPQELPHLVVEEPKRNPGTIFAIVVLSLLLLGLPIGIYLLPQQTQLIPQAAVTQKEPEIVAGIFLESKLNPDSNDGVIPVDIYIKSPADAINLVNAQIRFNPSLLSLDKIATGSGSFNKWVEASFDNTRGSASVISGAPAPGIKTGGSSDEKIYLATLHLRPKKTASAVLQVSADSGLLRNSDNNNIFKSGNDLALNLSAPVNVVKPSANPDKPKTQESLIVLTNPVAAANYSYFKPISITWSSFNVSRISEINLFLNGELLGPVTRNLEAKTGKFDWQPQETLALPYIQLANTFVLEMVGVSKDGNVVKALSGPFGILGTENVTGSPPNPEAFAKNQLAITDVSRALSSYLILPLKETALDLNKDGAINELDLFLIRKNLLVRGVIR